MIRSMYHKSTSHLALAPGLQLQEVDLPDEFDVEIANTQTQLQDGDGMG